MSDSSSPTDALQERAHAVARVAQSIIGKVRGLALYAALSAVWLWIALFVLLGSLEHTIVALTAVLVGGAFLLPPAVLYLLTLGLDGLMHLPSRVAEMASAGQAQARETLRPAPEETAPQRWWRIGKVIAGLWKMRELVIDYKVVLVRYAAAVRLLTLPGLMLVLGALLLSGVLIIGAVLSVPVVALLLLLIT